MLKKNTLAALLVMSGFGLAACDVDQTREANVTVPQYEKTRDGDVTLPKAEVNTPDVEIKEEQKTVETPKIETEERTVRVPDVDVKPAQENDAAQAERQEKEG